MDVVCLARIQFAFTAGFHFLFPPITIGLALLIAVIETLRWRTGGAVYERASDFWLRVFAVNFAIGVATGIVMEFQFGTNWAVFSRFVGDVFGAPLAAEAVFAFFLESGFVGLLLLGRKRISSPIRWLASVMVALGSTLSALFILIANSWMQTPAGFVVEGDRARLSDFWAAAFNPSTVPRIFHTIASSWACGAFLMAGIAAWYHLKGRVDGVTRLSLRLGSTAAVVSTALVFLSGDQHARQVANTQEAKFAAIEGLFSTQRGAPFILFSLPPTQNGPGPGPKLMITHLTSFLAFRDFEAPVKGLSEFPERDWPPVALTFLSFHNMFILGNLMLLVSAIGVYLWWRGKIDTARTWQTLMMWSIALPTAATQLGWLTAEVGRQPWIVYGVMRTRDAVSPVVTAPEVLFSIVLFAAIYLSLGALWLFLLRREVLHGPAPDFAPHASPEA